MMGTHHAASGAAVWCAITLPSPIGLDLVHLSPSAVLVGTLVCAGAALLPDADHHSGSIAWSLPPVSKWVCRGIGHIADGHRNGTHSLLATILAAALAWGLGHITFQTEWTGSINLGAAVLCLLLSAFATQALGLAKPGLQWVVALVFTAVVAIFAPDSQEWFPLAVAAGYVTHLVGDMLTPGGVPLFWPWKPAPPKMWKESPLLSIFWRSSGRMSVPILARTGGNGEKIIGVALAFYALAGTAAASASLLASLGVTPFWEASP